MTSKSIPATKAKTAFAELIDSARKEPVTITRNNRPVAVMLSPDEYEYLVAQDDAYWSKQAQHVKDSEYLGTKKSAQFLHDVLK